MFSVPVIPSTADPPQSLFTNLLNCQTVYYSVSLLMSKHFIHTLHLNYTVMADQEHYSTPLLVLVVMIRRVAAEKCVKSLLSAKSDANFGISVGSGSDVPLYILS